MGTKYNLNITQQDSIERLTKRGSFYPSLIQNLVKVLIVFSLQAKVWQAVLQ